MYEARIFSYKKETPIKNWLQNCVDSLVGNTINLPTNWTQVAQVNNPKYWPILFSLAMERIERERLAIPVAAFQFWLQAEFKALLKATMDKAAFYKFRPEKVTTKCVHFIGHV